MNTPSQFPRIVSFTGAAGAGKTTAARIVVATYPDFHRLSFADPIRDMLRAVGLTTEHFSQERKEVPTELLCGRSPRHAMQTLGTDWARRHIGSDFWLNAAMRKADQMVADRYRVTIDDVRFDNEAKAVLDRGGVVVRVVRPSLVTGTPTYEHESERGVSHELITRILIADDIPTLRTQLFSFLNEFTAY